MPCERSPRRCKPKWNKRRLLHDLCSSRFLFVFILVEPHLQPSKCFEGNDGVAEVSTLGTLTASPIMGAIVTHQLQTGVLVQTIPTDAGNIFLVKILIPQGKSLFRDDIKEL